jgi:CHAT domain
VAQSVSNLNVVLVPQAGGGALLVAVEDFALAFAPVAANAAIVDLITTRDQIEQSLRDNADRPTQNQLKQYGRKIASVLLAGDVSDLYRAVSNGRIQVTLNMDDQSLKRVPWEYLLWPGLPYGPHTERTIARIVPLARGSRPEPRKLNGGAINVLLIGADVLGLDPIPWDETKSNLERIFGERLRLGATAARVQMTPLEGATRASLRQALTGQKYDIVHFIGHGQPSGVFLRGRDGQQREMMTTEAFIAMLGDTSPVLVILSACDTARIADIQPLGTIAEELVAADIPAVVANQMPITVTAIADFSVGLYRSLLSEGNIDVAVNRGRIELVAALAAANTPAVEWGIPVLYRRSGCSQIFAP